MTKAKYLGLIGILFLSAVLGGAQLTSGHNWAYSDFSSYIMQAQSIVNGTTSDYIARNAITVYQSDIEVGPLAYPWGYPLFLSPVVAFLGISTLGMKLINVIFYLAFLVALFFLFKRRLPFAENLALISLFAVSPVFLSYENYILSDIAFLFFSTFALYLIERFSFSSPPVAGFRRRSLIGLGIFLAFLVRTNGLLLLPTLFLYEALPILAYRKKHKIPASVFFKLTTPYLIFIGLWAAFSLFLPDGQGSHFSHYSYQTFARIAENIQYYFRAAGDFFAPLPYATIFYHAFTLLFLLGIWTRRRDETGIALYFILTFALYISWPDQQGLRFLLPILPLFIYLAWMGLRKLLERLPGQTRKRLLTLVWLLIFIPSLAESGSAAAMTIASPAEKQGPFRAVSMEMFNYIEANTPADSLIVFYKPRVMRLMTDRNAILILECEHLTRGDYFVFSKEAENSGQLTQEDLARCEVPRKTVFSNRKFIIYRIGEN